MKSVSLAAAALLIACSHAAAQQAQPEQPRCWLGSMGFSPGAKMRAGDGVMVCSPSFVWEPTTAAAAGCIFKGELYGVGSVDGSPDAPKNECHTDGSWTAAPAQ